MLLLLFVLSAATSGERVIALFTSISASLSFSYYFIETVGSLRITSFDGAVTFAVMVLVAMLGSQMAVRAQRRAREAIQRRNEMERLHRLGSSLLAVTTVADASRVIVRSLVEVFGLRGARLWLRQGKLGAEFGVLEPAASAVIRLDRGNPGESLELYGEPPTGELESAIAYTVNLALDRAGSAEERARVEAQQRGEELRNTILNALAHDFKTPLTSIKAAASMLLGSNEVRQGFTQELVSVIDEEADRLDRLIRESLDLARIQAHRANPRVETCRLQAITEAVTGRMARYLGGRRLDVDLPEDLPVVHGDRFLFEQMLAQVVDNAWKYSRPGARIRISACAKDNGVILSVQNEGSQIPDEERSRIFGKFYRGAGEGSKVEGTGLGLAIARSIAEAHGGNVWLDAEAEGPVFRFFLPAETQGKRGLNDREPNYIAD